MYFITDANRSHCGSPVRIRHVLGSSSARLIFPSLLYRPELFEWKGVEKQTDIERLDHAFSLAKQQLGIEKLLDPEGECGEGGGGWRGWASSMSNSCLTWRSSQSRSAGRSLSALSLRANCHSGPGLGIAVSWARPSGSMPVPLRESTDCQRSIAFSAEREKMLPIGQSL